VSLRALCSAGCCYICATVAEALTEGRAKRFVRYSAVDALDHPRVAVAHRYTDEVGFDTAQTEPCSIAAPEVVRRGLAKGRKAAKLTTVPPRKGAVQPFCPSAKRSVFQERLAQADDGQGRAASSVLVPRRSTVASVRSTSPSASALGLAAARPGREDERDAGRMVAWSAASATRSF
jgi:hypothetical protein